MKCCRDERSVIIHSLSLNMSDEEYEYEEEEEYEYESDGGGFSSPVGLGRSASESSAASGGVVGERRLDKSGQYRLVPPSEIEKVRNRAVREVADFLAVTAEQATMLMVEVGWRRDALFNAFTEGDSDLLRVKAGLEPGDKAAPPDKPMDGRLMCGVCWGDFGVGEMVGIGVCGHSFCRDCWRAHMLSAVSTLGELAVQTRCPAEGCQAVVPSSVVDEVADADTAAKWHKAAAANFVGASDAMAWCPEPACGEAYSAVGHPSSSEVHCICGYKFCFKCGHQAHRPVECDLLKLWIAKCEDESETANWLISNTKRCPKCAVRINKDGGCNHMTCKTCKHEFCWICQGPWSEHGSSSGGYYSCNRYKPDDKASKKDLAKQELDRYLHYFFRYDEHDRAGKFAADLRRKTQERMAALQAAQAEAGSTWADVAFLEDAVEVLIDCRRVLKYTYALGFYMKEGPEKTLFESLQTYLEASTEHLSELTEKPVESMVRSDVINYAGVTEKFLRRLLEGVDEGLTGAPEMGVVGGGEGARGAAGGGGSMGSSSSSSSSAAVKPAAKKSGAATKGSKKKATTRRRG